jgi:hypothetical protein
MIIHDSLSQSPGAKAIDNEYVDLYIIPPGANGD